MRQSTLLSLFLVLLWSAGAGAQSMTVFGGNSYAKECYMSASFAVQIGGANHGDLDACDKAILHGDLSLRDLTATLVNRGILHAAMDDYARAEQDYSRAMELSPERGEVFVNRGNLEFLRKDYSNAVDEYTQALSVGLGKIHIAHYNRGMAYEKLGDRDRAEADYRRASELVPEWYLPQARLTRLMARAQR